MKKLLCLLVLLIPGILKLASAQVPGTLDSTFATNGLQTLKPSSGFDNAYSVHILPDGKMLIGGASQVTGSSNWDVIVYRLNTDGGIDSTFGINGYAYSNYQGYSQYVRTMKVLSDGKLLFVGGIEDDNFQVDVFATRLNEDGTPDLSFGDNGTVVIPVGSGEDICMAVVEQLDSKLILAGKSNVPGFIYTNSIVIRMNSDGTLDNDYGTNGIVTLDAGYDYESAEDMMLLDDGSLLVSGYVGSNHYDILTFKLTDTGAPDVTFGSNGTAIFNLNNGDDMAYAILRSPFDNRILIGGRVGDGSTKTDFLVMAITESGLLDSTFGNNGRASIHIKVNDAGLDLAVQANGRIVLGGTSGAGFATNDFAICRFNDDGSIDSTFGTNGATLSEVSSFFSDIEDIALQADGKIVAAGIAANFNNDMGIVRYKGDDIATSTDDAMTSAVAAFSAFPNPSAGLFMIQWNAPMKYTGPATLQLINLQGQAVYEKAYSLHGGMPVIEVNAADKIYASGVYLLKITAGGIIHRQPVFIQK
ncbi:MAG: T9SS type A sorting domain-containing protein [Chitinophagales bacterium]|nr:T9SS type A sorting domain-containing protein [Chitinophagaceae bacterium]MBP9882796.1 T9SS type A sorting domain-containing protein [Chitinophagales bacterium]